MLFTFIYSLSKKGWVIVSVGNILFTAFFLETCNFTTCHLYCKKPFSSQLNSYNTRDSQQVCVSTISPIKSHCNTNSVYVYNALYKNFFNSVTLAVFKRKVSSWLIDLGNSEMKVLFTGEYREGMTDITYRVHISCSRYLLLLITKTTSNLSTIHYTSQFFPHPHFHWQHNTCSLQQHIVNTNYHHIKFLLSTKIKR